MTKLYDTVAYRVALMIQGLAIPNVEREEGQTLAEYALILAGIAIAVILAIAFLGGAIGGEFSSIADKI